jgi:hypothetical protein
MAASHDDAVSSHCGDVGDLDEDPILPESPDDVPEPPSKGPAASAAALFAAIEREAVDTLELLLSAGVDPNLRSDRADTTLSGLQEHWASGDSAPHFHTDQHEWYALQHAASLPSRTQEDKNTRPA